MSENNKGRICLGRPRRRLVLLTVAALLLAAVVAGGLVLPGWRAQRATRIREEPQPLTAQEVADVKAAVEKETGATVRYVVGNRQGTVEVFTAGPGERGFAYRVKKTEGRWRVIEKFMAFFA